MTNSPTPQPDRRTVNSMLVAAAASPLIAPAAAQAQAPVQGPAGANFATMRPFRVEIPQAKLDHIRARLRDLMQLSLCA